MSKLEKGWYYGESGALRFTGAEMPQDPNLIPKADASAALATQQARMLAMRAGVQLDLDGYFSHGWSVFGSNGYNTWQDKMNRDSSYSLLWREMYPEVLKQVEMAQDEEHAKGEARPDEPLYKATVESQQEQQAASAEAPAA